MVRDSWLWPSANSICKSIGSHISTSARFKTGVRRHHGRIWCLTGVRCVVAVTAHVRRALAARSARTFTPVPPFPHAPVPACARSHVRPLPRAPVPTYVSDARSPLKVSQVALEFGMLLRMSLGDNTAAACPCNSTVSSGRPGPPTLYEYQGRSDVAGAVCVLLHVLIYCTAAPLNRQ